MPTILRSMELLVDGMGAFADWGRSNIHARPVHSTLYFRWHGTNRARSLAREWRFLSFPIDCVVAWQVGRPSVEAPHNVPANHDSSRPTHVEDNNAQRHSCTTTHSTVLVYRGSISTIHKTAACHSRESEDDEPVFTLTSAASTYHIARCQRDFVCPTLQIFDKNRPRLGIVRRVNVQDERDYMSLHSIYMHQEL